MDDAIIALFRQAVQVQQRGDLPAAMAACRRILELQPGNVDALHLSGLLCLRQGDAAQAVEAIDKAVTLMPDHPLLHTNLGVALRAAGRLHEALQHHDRAVELRPDYAEAFNNRGIVLTQLGLRREALASYDQAVLLRPDYAEALCSRGDLLLAANQFAEALISYDRAITARPQDAAAHNRRGNLLARMNRHVEAVASFDAALSLQPGFLDAMFNRGSAFHALYRADEAISAYQQVLDIQPAHPGALTNLASMLMRINRHEEAVALCRKALASQPNAAIPLNNLGAALQVLGRHREARECYDRALALMPDCADAHVNRAMLRLLQGDFAGGWPEYEWRWQVDRLRMRARHRLHPLWLGQPKLDGQTIVLHAEQGYGDVIQFCRYVPLVAAQARVILEVHPPLRRLMETLDCPVQVVVRGEELPPFELQCPLLSLPAAFGTMLDTVPAAVPYLSADPDRVEAWRARLAALPGMRVGLVWAGRREIEEHGTDLRRSLSLRHFAPLAACSGVSLVSLQKGDPATQLRSPPAGLTVHDWTDELDDFADTAALVSALDLVISVDTAVAHLAGALGKPVWILNRFDPDWRWLLGRDDNPWYPTARLFRQTVPGNWDDAFARLVRALQALAASPAPSGEPVSAVR